MTIAEALATRIAGVTYDSLPDEARHWAKVAIMDTVGCTLAGSDEPCASIRRMEDRRSRPRANFRASCRYGRRPRRRSPV